MKVKEMAEKINLSLYTDEAFENREVSGCYIGDLLSLAMSSVCANDVWITIQTNVNVAAVAALTEAACVIIADGCRPDGAALERANEQGITILGSEKSAYELAKCLAELGI